MEKGYSRSRDANSPTDEIRRVKKTQSLKKSRSDGPLSQIEEGEMSPMAKRASSLVKSLQEEQRQRNLRLQASPRTHAFAAPNGKSVAENMASWAIGQMSKSRESRKVLANMLVVYRLQWAVTVLAVIGFFFTMRCEHLCTRGYQPTPEEVEQGAQDPFLLDPVDSKCEECTLLKAGAAVTTFFLLVAMVVQFRYRSRVLAGRMRLTNHHCMVQAQATASEDARASESSKTRGAEVVMHWSERGWMYVGFVVELAVCAVHPLWWYANDYKNEMMGREVYYRFESVVASFMLVRAYHLLRLYLLHVQWRFLADKAMAKGETQAGTMQLLQDPRIDLVGFSLKQAVARQPGFLVALMLFLCAACGAYLIRIGETPANPEHSEYVWNNLWLSMLALTTSDYGAVAPVTHYGRGICVLLMVMGPLLLASLAFSVSVGLTLSPLEQDISIKLAHDHIMARVRLAPTHSLAHTRHTHSLSHTHTRPHHGQGASCRRAHAPTHLPQELTHTHTHTHTCTRNTHRCVLPARACSNSSSARTEAFRSVCTASSARQTGRSSGCDRSFSVTSCIKSPPCAPSGEE
jgi:hypothetical protein